MTWKPDYYECLTCCDSGWIEETRRGDVTRYVGDFGVEGKPGKDKWHRNGPTETVEMDLPVAVPCPDCQKLARAAYDEGQLKHHMARRKRPDADRDRKVQDAKEVFGA